MSLCDRRSHDRGTPGRIEYDDLASENRLSAAQRRWHTRDDLGEV
jgi:hypothetical protein